MRIIRGSRLFIRLSPLRKLLAINSRQIATLVIFFANALLKPLWKYGFFTAKNMIYSMKTAQGIAAVTNLGPKHTIKKAVINLYNAEKV